MGQPKLHIGNHYKLFTVQKYWIRVPACPPKFPLSAKKSNFYLKNFSFHIRVHEDSWHEHASDVVYVNRNPPFKKITMTSSSS